MLSPHMSSTPEAPCQCRGAAKLCQLSQGTAMCSGACPSQVPKLLTSQAAITLRTQAHTSGRGPQLEWYSTDVFQCSFAKSPCSAPEHWSWPGNSMCRSLLMAQTPERGRGCHNPQPVLC